MSHFVTQCHTFPQVDPPLPLGEELEVRVPYPAYAPRPSQKPSRALYSLPSRHPPANAIHLTHASNMRTQPEHLPLPTEHLPSRSLRGFASSRSPFRSSPVQRKCNTMQPNATWMQPNATECNIHATPYSRQNSPWRSHQYFRLPPYRPMQHLQHNSPPPHRSANPKSL
jgi:hypothetical protein